MSSEPLPRLLTLDNGLRVVLDPMEHAESVSLGVWVDVGTRHEAPEINGISHMLEHMAFKGTARRSAQAISEEIESVGGMLNAHTARDHTAYYARVLADDTALALDILADILQHSTMDSHELDRERAVVLQEISQANDMPDDVIFDHFQATALPDQPLGRPILGTAEHVRGFTREQVLGFLSHHYSPPHLVLSLAGRLDCAQIEGMAGEKFAALPLPRTHHSQSFNYVGGEHRDRRKLEQVHLLIGFEGVAYDDPDYHAALVFSTLLGGGQSSRLYQEVREQRGLAYSVYSFGGSYSDGGVFGVYAGTGEREVAELAPLLCDELAKVRAAVSADEVARARTQLKASLLMGRESIAARCEQQARQLQVYGRVLSRDETVAHLDQVDEAAVLRVAERITRSTPTLAAVGPTKRLMAYEKFVERLR